MADRPSQLVLAALTRAAADPPGTPLFASKTGPGLFPANAAGKLAAQRACDEGYLEPDPAAPGNCRITAPGLDFLLGQVSPRQVLEDFVRVLEARHEQAQQLLVTARKMLSGIEALASTLLPVLDRASGGMNASFRQFHDPALPIVEALTRWGGPDDCPLPELFRLVGECVPGLTLGAFHDALRRLHQQGRVYLHPWTGPLYQLPQPTCALLVGHEVNYYASVCPILPASHKE